MMFKMLHGVWRLTETNRFAIAVEERSISNFYEHILSLSPQFLDYCFVKRVQAVAYKREKDSFIGPGKECNTLIKVDFSENYSCGH